MDIQDGKAGQGKKELLNHFEGKKLTFLQAIKAKCYDCMSCYVDGRVDCEIPLCPLYPFMPYSRRSCPVEALQQGTPKAKGVMPEHLKHGLEEYRKCQKQQKT